MSYNAIISTLINVRKHENADKLAIANCSGYQVIVGLDAKDGDKVILFSDDGQLSEEYCKTNDLIGYTDEEGNRKGGYFDQRRRVRAQIFRGVKSEAYVASIESLSFTGVDLSTLNVGDQFCEINGIPICNKYFTEKTLNRIKGQKKSKICHLKQYFKEHFDTEQFKHARDEEFYGLVTITSKYHGSSARSCLLNVPVKQNNNWFKRFLSRFNKNWFPNERFEYKSLYATRRVIKGEAGDHDDFRVNCHKKLQPYIEKGMTVFYEIVGYEESGKSIMPSASTDKLPKDFRKRFGKTITYKYGCLQGTCKILVYRITIQVEDKPYEFSWDQVKEWCKKAGILHVQELDRFLIKTEEDICMLKDKIEYYTEGIDMAEPMDESHIREGICVRVDKTNGNTKIYKNKLFVFRLIEGIIKDSGIEDQEEVESYTEVE
jgi:hypothetical protein